MPTGPQFEQADTEPIRGRRHYQKTPNATVFLVTDDDGAKRLENG